MECNHIMSQHHDNAAGYGTSKESTYDNQETETYVHWHPSLYLGFMTDERMTFDEFIAEQ